MMMVYLLVVVSKLSLVTLPIVHMTLYIHKNNNNLNPLSGPAAEKLSKLAVKPVFKPKHCKVAA